MPEHLTEGDFEENFPAAEDVFPTVQDNENYLDAIVFNKLSAGIVSVEDYLITYKANIESEPGMGGLGISAPVSTVAENKTLGLGGAGVGLASGILGQTLGYSVA